MASGSNGSAIDDILNSREAVERHFGIHIDSDESDLDVPSEAEWSSDCSSGEPTQM